MFNFLKAAPIKPTMTSSEKVDTDYKFWRLHLMFTMYIGYAVFYFTRKSFNFVMPAMVADLGLDKSDIGVIGTLFYLTYGCSKFVSGIVSDRANPRYFMGLGLIATGVINILFGLSSSILVLASLWMLNAFFQGWGWPPCSKLLTTWYSRSERGFWWSIWNTSHNVGGAIIPLLVGFLTLHYSWRMGMIVPGFCAIAVGVFLCWRLRDKPQTLGLPSIGEWRQDKLEQAYEHSDEGLSTKEILFKYVLSNKYIWLLALSYVLVYIVRTGINDWGNLYLTEEQGYDLMTANGAISLFEIGGFIGSLVAGWGSDILFKGNRGPMNWLFSIGILIAVSALWFFPSQGYFVQAACFFAIGFFVFGPQMLIGVAAAECSHKDAAGAATGFVGLFAYMGAALAGYPLARIIELYSWTGFFTVLTVSAGVVGLLLIPFLRKQAATTGM
ncbi:MFS transporter [Shewanella surugensis]|uniref:MFS transporter n=1 Tax=Shewanella surugensis TaxID=212020 RepID=A0ABT0L6E6_9GAMM|nr:MFS transporter [Shewanella surugensis]MCL1123262.1 MFS transporter [Shewanella surugensis]